MTWLIVAVAIFVASAVLGAMYGRAVRDLPDDIDRLHDPLG